MNDQQRFERLERRVKTLEARLASLAEAPPAWRDRPMPPMAAAAADLPPPRESGGDDSAEGDLETTMGANWLARAGIFVLALGCLFFFKLANDNGWIPIPVRYASGIAIGALLFAAGDLLRRRNLHPAFTQIVSGGGALVAYLTLYVGYALPEFRSALGIGQELEVVLLALASGLTGAYAVWRNLPILGGVAVAFSNVLVAPAGEFTVVGLVFVAFLDAAFLLAAAWRGWSLIVLTAALGANLVHVVAAFLDNVPWLLTLASAIALNLLAALAAHRARGEPVPSYLAMIVSGAGLVFVLGACLDRAGADHPVAWALLAVAAACLAGAAASARLRPALAPIAGLLLLAWPFAHFGSAGQQAFALASLGFALALLGLAKAARRPSVQAWSLLFEGVCLLVLFGVALVSREDAAEKAWATAAALQALAAGTLLAVLNRQPEGVPAVRWLGVVVAMAAPALLVPILLDGWAVAVSWGIEALLAIALGFFLGSQEVRMASPGLFAIVLVRVFAFDLQTLALPARVVAFLLTGGLLLLGSFLYARQRNALRRADLRETA